MLLSSHVELMLMELVSAVTVELMPGTTSSSPSLERACMFCMPLENKIQA